MNVTHYIGFDVHKKHINFCAKTASCEIVDRLLAQRSVLREWARRPQPWRGAMEATLFSAWIYDTLKPYGQGLEMAHPAMLKAIVAAKKKNDRIDARTIADLLRCNLLPTCYVGAPEIRELRRLLRYRNLVVRESVRMQNKIAGLLMETGTPFVKEKLHGKKYFANLLQNLEEVPESVKDLLRLSRGAMEMFQATQKRLIQPRQASNMRSWQQRQRIFRKRGIPDSKWLWGKEFQVISRAFERCAKLLETISSSMPTRLEPTTPPRRCAWEKS